MELPGEILVMPWIALQELLKRLKEMKPYSLPDPALRQPELPLSNVVIVNHTDREALQRYHDEKEQLLVGYLEPGSFCILLHTLKECGVNRHYWPGIMAGKSSLPGTSLHAPTPDTPPFLAMHRNVDLPL